MPEHINLSSNGATAPDSIVARFERVVAARPDAVAISSRGQRMTYAELNRAANRLARSIVARVGDDVAPLALLLPHEPGIIVAIVATLKAGKFYAALDPFHPRERLAATLADLQPQLIITNRANAGTARVAAGDSLGVIEADALDADIADDDLELALAGQRPLGIFYTSGSTGRPKGVVRDQRSTLVRLDYETGDYFTRDDDRVAILHSSSFGTSVHDLFGAILSGGTACMYDLMKLGTNGFDQWLRDEAITLLHMPIALFRQFEADLRPTDRFDSVRQLALSGQLFRTDIENVWKHFPADATIVSRYATNETGQTTRWLIHRDSDIGGEIVPVGFPVPDRAIELVGEDSRPTPRGESGEIVVKGRTLSLGYWRNPDLTVKVFTRDPDDPDLRVYRTGDWGRIRPDGQLEFLGRKDERVKVRGYSIELSEVEAAVRGIEGVRDAAATTQRDYHGEARLAVYWLAAPDSSLTPRELRQQLATRLPSYMLPSAWMQLDEFPLTDSGKVNRRALPQIGRARPDLGVAYVGPRTPIEKSLCEIWSEVLGIEPVGVDDQFLDLGGDSLQANRIAARVFQNFDMNLKVRDLFDNGTVATMALAVTQFQASSTDSLELDEVLRQLEAA